MFLRQLPVPWKIATSILNDRQKIGRQPKVMGSWDESVFFFHEDKALQSYHPDADICTEDLPQKQFRRKQRGSKQICNMGAMFLRPLPVPWKIPPSILNDRQRKSGGNQRLWKVGRNNVFFFFFHKDKARNHAWKNGKGGPI
ncbi:hypothetical protein CEXT_415531 [Caerostris extrusa]|uniref:Uncharacterized protein n=1 Tax=Caerostris extrusa TaxID=172846 RepID=A0AAV4N3N3_CAEEX|nr:hypothetical protein CEXT_415531 [Caerostris extrusa]